MKLKHINQLLLALIFSVILASCSDNNKYEMIAPSADAQIYSFSISATASNKLDSLTFPQMAATKFAIDQQQSLIYNRDSLAYKTPLKKFKVDLRLATQNPLKLEVIYYRNNKDSVVIWDGKDSVDFSLPYPKIRITPANGENASAKTYTIDLRIHQIDPDTLVWTKMKFEQPAAINKQKTILKDKTFYTFSIDKDGSFSLYTANKSADNSMTWNAKKTTSGIPASKVVLESILLFNNKFYAVDSDQKAYSSTDGQTWSESNNNTVNILGILPGKTDADDSILIITKEDNKYYFAKTSDMTTLTIIKNVSNNPLEATVVSQFPVKGFSSMTNFDRKDSNFNILMVTAGKTLGGDQSNLTWSVKNGSNGLEVISNQDHYAFKALPGIVTFLYNNTRYALAQNKLFTAGWSFKWSSAPSKETLLKEMPQASGQSVIVDEENYIWVFGGVPDSGTNPVHSVWKGRLNKLNPIK